MENTFRSGLKVVFSNPNIPRSKGIINPKEFTPFSKNPTISKLMLQMGRVEEVGSGMRNVFKYLPHYAENTSAEFKEDDMFTTTILLSDADTRLVEKLVEKGFKLGETQMQIFKIIMQDNKVTISKLSKLIGVSTTAIDKNLVKLKDAKIIERIGPDKGGHWKILINL